MPDNAYIGTNRPEDAGCTFNAFNAMIRRVMGQMGANLPVKVLAVNGVGLNPVGFVDVQPLVHQVDGTGKPTPRGVIYDVPYIRMQGGSRAIICDPQVGDIGYAIVSGRDISNVKVNRAASVPGSYRHHDVSDAVYVGGLLNAAPTEYIGWVDNDVHVHTAGKFIVDAASMQVNCAITTTGDITAQGTVTGQTDVKAAGISGKSHTHPVTDAPGETGAPE
ncbi:phage baseplate assembly protein [Komagataeibacter intermedius TF2]|uniref:Phage baseplate assembly protein n=2 Tax=Komagataeibacter intermedius TaxID=66229 RepID=A0ABQ0PGK9_9PROT|nr:Gp138 family membrane-puncturing spike protein [Komagataeibacter intermedius]GAN86336.1 phage baseplate assembly protein [Komagataeibacter intermedius TF2]GBQ67881.1 phage baseplate assembly protein [Komagataeibacter intermedius NRIC 0521]